MITGNNKLSLIILQELASGRSINDIVSVFDITLDQAKKLSRLSNELISHVMQHEYIDDGSIKIEIKDVK